MEQKIKTISLSELSKSTPKLKSDSPVSFICGKETIIKHGFIETERAITVYIFKQSEVGDGKWFDSKIPKSRFIVVHCMPDEYTYFEWIKYIIGELDQPHPFFKNENETSTSHNSIKD